MQSRYYYSKLYFGGAFERDNVRFHCISACRQLDRACDDGSDILQRQCGLQRAWETEPTANQPHGYSLGGVARFADRNRGEECDRIHGSKRQVSIAIGAAEYVGATRPTDHVGPEKDNVRSQSTCR